MFHSSARKQWRALDTSRKLVSSANFYGDIVMSQQSFATRTEHTLRNPENIMRLSLGFFQSKVLLSATELGVFTELAKQPLDAAQLSAKLGLHDRGSRDFFDALVSLGMLQRNGTVYQNTAETDYFLDEAKPSYIGGLITMANSRLYHSWGKLTDALRTGKPQNESSHSEDMFKELYADKQRLEGFLGAMTGISLPLARTMAEKFEWANYKTFTDVGCAQGSLPVEVARKHLHLQGTGFDLPQVEPIFSDYVKRHDLDARLNFKAGDFWKDDLPATDVIVMGHILHDWDLEQKKTLVRKAHKALNDGGSFIVYDAMIDPERKEKAYGLLMSLNMLIETHGGFDYTTSDCLAWLKEAGFKNVRVVELSPTHSMCIGVK